MNGTLGACCSALLTAALTTSCTPEEKTLSPPRIRPVRYQEVAQVAATRIRTFSGAAKAAMESKISFKVAGTVTTPRRRSGRQSTRGTVDRRARRQGLSLESERGRGCPGAGKGPTSEWPGPTSLESGRCTRMTTPPGMTTTLPVPQSRHPRPPSTQPGDDLS